MQNFYAIEIEANYQRHDQQRKAAAAARADLTCPPRRRIRWPHVPVLVLVRLRPLIAPRVRLQEPWTPKAGTWLPRAP
jgi:hypothetical protein